ncbi:beta-galactosidase [Granulosicoccus sp. 3-233]|uniref:beta-galactosidase n=1 Tax=Granulosicoccus sp. 3-233 TaxID=3417969 RepID=UPI003D32E857
MTFEREARQTLGVCYYPEHWPESRWPIDAQMMAAAGIEYVRIAEFAWSLLEPRPGVHDWGWLDRAIDELAAMQLKVVLCTPTATPPKWLVDQMPDMLPVDAQGQVRGFGSRRHYCFSHEGYRRECARITDAMARRYGDHPAVAAWQTDNEYGCHRTTLSYSDAALSGFRRWLADRYQEIGNLNRAWGNVFWSMIYDSFEQIEFPAAAVTQTNPSHQLDFRRYASEQVASFNKLQTDIIRQHSPGRPISHNFMGKFFEFDHYAVSQELDIAAWDAYPLGFLDREIGDEALMKRYMGIGHPDFDPFHHDLYRSCGELRNGQDKGRWWVMEQQPPGPLNWGAYNPAPLPGAGRLWVWEAFAAGAEVVSFFRWRQPSFAQEQMHEGLLLPDGEANDGYRLCCEINEELQQLLPEPGSSRAEVALIFDYDSQWMMEIQPTAADASHFDSVLQAYAALRRAGISVDIVPPTENAIAGRKLVVMPMLTHITPEFAENLAASEAVVLAGPWTGAKSENLGISEGLPPGALRQLIDIRIRRVETRPAFAPFNLAEGGTLAGWLETVVAGDKVEVMETLENGQATALRSGRTIYLAGRYENAALDRVTRQALELAGLPWLDLPPDIRVRDNGNRRYLFNYGRDTQDLSALFPGAQVDMGSLQLESCGVACIRQPVQPATQQRVPASRQVTT